MHTIGDYEILEKIAETGSSFVYRGRKKDESETVIIKVIRALDPKVSQVEMLKKEYEIQKNIQMEGIVKANELIIEDNTFALILEDFEGESIAKMMAGKKMDLKEFLRLAVNIAEILGKLHEINIVHRDIKPHNILVKGYLVKLTDFGIAAKLLHISSEIEANSATLGTLDYISPEQTGRMNRNVDYRTDLYSLGATFYKMLTGKPPFESDDPMQVIHGHLAKIPTPPSEVDPSIPTIISNIIMKLLSKNADDRYQNSLCLMYDLKNCLDQHRKKGTIAEFNLAKDDIYIKFNFPQILAGRENELQTLMDGFKTAKQGKKAFYLVTGKPGIGKSAFEDEIRNRVLALKGLFVSAKLEKDKVDIPYSSIMIGIQYLMDQFLMEGEKHLIEWRKKFQEALGDIGAVLTEAIPKLGLIIGDQPEIPELDGVEAKNRLSLAFKHFMSVLSQKDHPLVAFFDDINWMDSASLDLFMGYLADSSTKHFMIIGAYRIDALNDHHPLKSAMEMFDKNKIVSNTLVLKPLDIDSVNEMLSCFLRSEKEKSYSLAEVIHKKTNGNPLFVKELLKSAYEENKLTFVPGLGWKWNFQQINDMRFSESMAALMAERIAGYDRNIQTIIKTSACLGSSFDLTILSDIIEKPVEQMVSGFKKLVEDGYFYQTENKYKFRHNRIKEVAYSLLSDVEKSETHYRIAKTWIKHSTEETIHQKIFKIVNHYNAGSAVVKSKAEKRYLASLNLRAGEQSKASSAFSSARIYLEKGLTFLSDESWNEDYELTLLLYQNAAEIALFTANHENLEKLGQEVLDHAKNMLDKTKIYTFRIRSLMERFRHPEALSMGIMVLKQMGIEINENIEKEYIKSEYIKTKNALLDNLDKLDKLPEIEDPKMLVAIRIMAHLIIGTYFIPGGGRLRLLLSFKPTQLALEHGRSPMALSAISVMGTIMCAEGDIDEGCEIGRIALEQADYFKYKAVIPRLQYLFATHIIYHKRSLKDIAEDYLDIYQKALEVGDLEIASMAVFQHVNHLMYKNYSSSQILAEVNTYRPHLKQMGAEFWFQNVTILGQYHSNLNGEAIDPTVLNGKYFNKEIMLPILWQNNFLSTVLMVYFQECLLLLSFEKYVEAFTLMEKAVPYLRTVRSTISEMNANFYFSIIRLAAYPQMTPPVQKKILEQVEEDQKQLKAWADKASTNHLHRYFLVEAEKARVQKTDSSKTMDLYQKALVSAEKANLDLEIIYDRTAGFWFEKGMTDIAELYFIKAHRVAPPAKKDFYSLKYPHFFCKDDIFSISNTTSSTITKKQSDSTIDSESSQSTTSTEILDMNTVVRASQAISGEIILDKLLFKMTKIAMENAGAQKGFLIRKSLDNVYIEAAADNNKESSVDVKAIPLDESKELCQAIVNYVIRTGEDIVLHNALAKGDFAQDPYIKQNEIKSVLCTPFRYKEEIYGAFYLENNLVSFAFTKDRIKLLQVLLSQAAISMENAELFEKHIQDQKELTNHRDHLEKLVKERTLELEKVHRDLVEKAHQAGMAEIAINTLHNIGNILNSVKTSSQITLGVLRQSEFSSFKKANNLLKEHMDHIEDFIANDPKGKKLLDYYIKMEEVLEKEQNLIDDNVARIVDKVGDIEEVISAQRKYTEVGSVLITYSLPTIVEDVLTMQSKLFEGPPIKIVKNFKKVPDILTQKSKLMNILTNLIMNAKDAMDGNVDNRVLTITIENDEKWLYLKIQDTGKGIPHENLKKIFAFGFTTTIGNLGFGLHFSANSMKEMGGDMWAESDGEKKGAAFILKFPLSQSTSSKK